MSEESPISFNLDTGGIDTSIPSIQKGEYRAIVKSINGSMSKNTDGLMMAKVEFTTQEPATSTKGKNINPGFPVFWNLTFPLPSNHPNYKDETDNPKTGIRVRSIARFQDAVLGTSDENRPPFSSDVAAQMIGKPVKVIIKDRKEKSEDYGDTEVKECKAVAA